MASACPYASAGCPFAVEGGGSALAVDGLVGDDERDDAAVARELAAHAEGCEFREEYQRQFIAAAAARAQAQAEQEEARAFEAGTGASGGRRPPDVFLSDVVQENVQLAQGLFAVLRDEVKEVVNDLRGPPLPDYREEGEAVGDAGAAAAATAGAASATTGDASPPASAPPNSAPQSRRAPDDPGAPQGSLFQEMRSALGEVAGEVADGARGAVTYLASVGLEDDADQPGHGPGNNTNSGGDGVAPAEAAEAAAAVGGGGGGGVRVLTLESGEQLTVLQPQPQRLASGWLACERPSGTAVFVRVADGSVRDDPPSIAVNDDEDSAAAAAGSAAAAGGGGGSVTVDDGGVPVAGAVTPLEPLVVEASAAVEAVPFSGSSPSGFQSVPLSAAPGGTGGSGLGVGALSDEDDDDDDVFVLPAGDLGEEEAFGV